MATDGEVDANDDTPTISADDTDCDTPTAAELAADDGSTPTNGNGPGFGRLVALVGSLAAALWLRAATTVAARPCSPWIYTAVR